MVNDASDRWRDLALQHLPELEQLIAEAESRVDLWQLFKERLSDSGIHDARSSETASIYTCAWWCVNDSDDEDMIAAVEAYFYEDLPVYSDFEEQLPQFISPQQFERLETSFRYRLSDDEFATFRTRYMEIHGEGSV